MPDTLPPPPNAVEPGRSEAPSLSDFDSHFNDLEVSPTPPEPTSPEPASPPPAAPPAPEPTKPTIPPKDPLTGKFTKPPEKPAEPSTKPATKPEPDHPTGDEGFEPPGAGTMTQVRGWAIRAGKRLKQAVAEAERLKTELQDAKTTSPNVDVKALTDQLAQAKKQLESYEGEIRLTKYERSTEYKDKYEKPYQSAVAQAYADVDELIVTEPNADDPEHPHERKATRADFDEIYSMPLGQAGRVAKAKFGDSAFLVLQHRTAIKNAAKAAVAAIEEHKAKATEYEQQQTAQEKLQEEGRSQMLSMGIEAMQKKFPNLFGERDGDNEWNQAIEKGTQIASLAFSDRSNLTSQQSALLDAQVFNRVRGFGALHLDNAKLRAENEKLTKEIADLRGSAPGKPTPAAAPSGTPPRKNSIEGIDDLPE